MKQQSLSRLVAAVCIVCASSGAMAAQTAKQDKAPARWSQGDSTQQQRMGILKKEIGAAYAEQTAACKRGAADKRTVCMKQARATYDHDSANARQLVANAPQSSVSERVVSVTPAPLQTQDGGMQAGSGAYGGSSGGATGSSQMQSGQPQSGQMQSGQMQSGQMQSGVGSGMNQSGAQVNPQADPQSMQQADPQNRSGMRSNGNAYGNSSTGATSTGRGAMNNGMRQSGSQNGGSQPGMNQSGMNPSGMSGTGTTQSQSMGAGTGATQSDQQGDSGTVPPVQR
jgi:hypothetical protein